jgi:hypothetical protein
MNPVDHPNGGGEGKKSSKKKSPWGKQKTMAQFDSLIIFPLLFSLLISLTLHYYISITLTIPNFFEVKKFRKKNLKFSSFYLFFTPHSSLSLLNSTDSYKQVVFYD